MMHGANPVVLLVDADVRGSLRLLLESDGLGSHRVREPIAALHAVRHRDFSCALIDLDLAGGTRAGLEGFVLLDQLLHFAPQLPVIVMSAAASVPLAVEALQRGAADFIEKPWDDARLLNSVRNQVTRHLQAQMAVDASIRRAGGETSLIAESAAMQRVLELIARIAPSDTNVLVQGENGTGKGLIATKLHAMSRRSAQPLVKVNMGCIAENMFESEMFGHVSGAFAGAGNERLGRFELANDGTLFLDEVGDVPLSQQPKLLRVLEEGEFEQLGCSQTRHVDVRLISATHADLVVDVASGRFRRDLLYRLNTTEIHLPPLRDRRDDIIPLARQFLRQSAARCGREKLQLTPTAERALLAWPWPGNVRELGHMMERAALLAERDLVTDAALAFGPSIDLAHDFEQMTMEQAEAWLVRRALDRHGGNLQRTADALGITRQTLYRRLEKHALRETALAN
ncbi:MAG: sigma-54 dependent transcriptional regulator [Steroidobacteraceae bacterium]